MDTNSSSFAVNPPVPQHPPLPLMSLIPPSPPPSPNAILQLQTQVGILRAELAREKAQTQAARTANTFILESLATKQKTSDSTSSLNSAKVDLLTAQLKFFTVELHKIRACLRRDKHANAKQRRSPSLLGRARVSHTSVTSTSSENASALDLLFTENSVRENSSRACPTSPPVRDELSVDENPPMLESSPSPTYIHRFSNDARSNGLQDLVAIDPAYQNPVAVGADRRESTQEHYRSPSFGAAKSSIAPRGARSTKSSSRRSGHSHGTSSVSFADSAISSRQSTSSRSDGQQTFILPRENMPDEWFSAGGARFSPPGQTPNTRRVVMIGNLPLATTLAQVLDKVRGGRVLSAEMLHTRPIAKGPRAIEASLTATVVFCSEHSAANYAAFAAETQIKFGDRIAKVTHLWMPTFPMSKRMVSKVERHKCTRCLTVKYFPQDLHLETVRKLLRRGDGTESHGILTIDEENKDRRGADGTSLRILHLQFKSIDDAGWALAKLNSFKPFRQPTVKIAADPCDQPMQTLLDRNKSAVSTPQSRRSNRQTRKPEKNKLMEDDSKKKPLEMSRNSGGSSRESQANQRLVSPKLAPSTEFPILTPLIGRNTANIKPQVSNQDSGLNKLHLQEDLISFANPVADSSPHPSMSLLSNVKNSSNTFSGNLGSLSNKEGEGDTHNWETESSESNHSPDRRRYRHISEVGFEDRDRPGNATVSSSPTYAPKAPLGRTRLDYGDLDYGSSAGVPKPPRSSLRVDAIPFVVPIDKNKTNNDITNKKPQSQFTAGSVTERQGVKSIDEMLDDENAGSSSAARPSDCQAQ